MIRIMVVVVSRLTISCYKTATMLFSLGFFSRPEIDVILLQLPYASRMSGKQCFTYAVCLSFLNFTWYIEFSGNKCQLCWVRSYGMLLNGAVHPQLGWTFTACVHPSLWSVSPMCSFNFTHTHLCVLHLLDCVMLYCKQTNLSNNLMYISVEYWKPKCNDDQAPKMDSRHTQVLCLKNFLNYILFVHTICRIIEYFCKRCVCYFQQKISSTLFKNNLWMNFKTLKNNGFLCIFHRSISVE